MTIFDNEKVNEHLTRIYGVTGEQAYLLCGSERAYLFDSLCGVGDLGSYVKELTDLPVTMLLTHGHVDHGGGAGQFEDVYLSPLDYDLFDEHIKVGIRKVYLANSYVRKDITGVPFAPEVNHEHTKPLEDGMVFDAGGVHVEINACHGHTGGSMVFLIPEDKILLAGDCANFFTMVQGEESLSVHEFRDNLKAAREKLAGRYDTVLLSHGRFNVPVNLLENVEEVCDEVLNNQDDKVPFKFMGVDGYVAKSYGKDWMRTDGGFGNIVYNPENL